MAQDPDRNLALELVRATEAAAINCSRYLGYGDKNQVDAAAVDAMRPVLGAVRMNGVVVIGEGEKDEAPDALQRRAGRRRLRPGVGHRGRPGGRHHADRQEPARRGQRARRLPARHHVQPRPGGLHAEAGGARRGRRGGRPGRADRRHPGQDRQGQRPAGRRADRGHPGPAPARRPGRRHPGRRSPDPVPARRRRGRRDHGGHPGHRGRPAGRRRRHARRACWRPAPCAAWAGRCSAG